MNDNVRELSSHRKNGVSGRLWSPEQWISRQNTSDMLDFVSSFIIDLAVWDARPDSMIKVLLPTLEDSTVEDKACWILTETIHGGAQLLDITSRKPKQTYQYFMGIVLTKHAEILEFERAADDKDDIGLVHVVGRHAASYIKDGEVFQNGNIDAGMTLINLDYLAQRVKPDNSIK